MTNVRLVSERTKKLAGCPPTVRLVVSSKPVPVSVMVSPPAELPVLALSEVMVGAVTAA